MTLQEAIRNAQELSNLTRGHYVVLECTGGYFPSWFEYYKQHHYDRTIVANIMPEKEHLI
jgi:hypothetical protein